MFWRNLRRKPFARPVVIGSGSPRPPPDIPPTWGRLDRRLLPFRGPTVVSVVAAGRSFSTSIRPGSTALPSAPLAVEQQLVDEALAAPAVMHQQIFQLFQPVQMALSAACRPSRCTARTSRRLKRKSRALHLQPFAFARCTMSSISSSRRRVCGGSSSSERPSTSCARRLASLDVVERRLRCRRWSCLDASAVLTGRWYWCSSAMERISVRYLV